MGFQANETITPILPEIHAIAGLCHVDGQEQKYLSPLGTKLYFCVNSSRKNSIVLTLNMAALSPGCKPRICGVLEPSLRNLL